MKKAERVAFRGRLTLGEILGFSPIFHRNNSNVDTSTKHHLYQASKPIQSNPLTRRLLLGQVELSAFLLSCPLFLLIPHPYM